MTYGSRSAITVARQGPPSDYAREVTALRERIELLEEENRQLKEKAAPPDLLFPRRWRLTGTEDKMLRALMGAPGEMNKQAIMSACYQNEIDEPELKIIDVFICKLRKKLAPDGIIIETLWGRGYWISPQMKAVIMQAVGATVAGSVNWVSGLEPAKTIREEWQKRSALKPHQISRLSHKLLNKRDKIEREKRGRAIRARRMALGLTQIELQAMAGAKHSYLSTAESGGGWNSLLTQIEDALTAEEARRAALPPEEQHATAAPTYKKRRGIYRGRTLEVLTERKAAGVLIKRGRDYLGLTQTQLAKAAGEWPFEISRIENGVARCGDRVTARVASTLAALYERRLSDERNASDGPQAEAADQHEQQRDADRSEEDYDCSRRMAG